MKHLFKNIILKKNPYFAKAKTRGKVWGFMVVEVLIAASIITISILASMAVAQKSVYISRQSFHATQAAFLLEEGAEAVRILRDNAWVNISSLTSGATYYLKFSGGTWITSATSADGIAGIFTRAVIFTAVNRDTSVGTNTSKDIVNSGGTDDPGTKLVTETVSWVEGGTTITKTLQFYITDVFS